MNLSELLIIFVNKVLITQTKDLSFYELIRPVVLNLGGHKIIVPILSVPPQPLSLSHQ